MRTELKKLIDQARGENGWHKSKNGKQYLELALGLASMGWESSQIVEFCQRIWRVKDAN